ncbi:hypothetical protein C1645_879331 [Glomus cerebriforme]|uniref:F-box domain-containing protein n=1 Tax=Glomus cerebriforme TaxID=658196 RepID=A0A397SH77_9GLOM|nr:hypothetical protein C1645_879331 [Glomus cerebriforme]
MTLPEDCIREIFEYLSEDKESLYSCLFTNRLFCRCVIPILWRTPWPRINISRDNNCWKILGKTIIKCFPKEIQSFLLKQYIQYRIYYLNPSLRQPPLFNYVSYIQEISPPVIKNLTGNIIDYYCNYYYDDWRIEKIEQMLNKEFWTLFMKYCFKIKYLDVPNFNLFEYHDSKNSLSSLSTLRINTHYHKEIIIELSKNVHTLKRIEIHLNDIEVSDYGIEQLILSQKNLKEISFIPSTYQKIFFNNQETIEYLSSSLKILEFYNYICLFPYTITSFINLIELKIDYSDRTLFERGVKKLKDVFLPKLEILSLINVKGKYLTIFTQLIEKTKGSLKILNIHFRKKYPLSLSPSSLSSIEYYLRTIQTTCPNIEVLPVWLISEISLIDFENLLKSCSKIRKIIIHVITTNSNFQIDTVLAKPVLYLLAIKSSSTLLNNIHLIGRWSFSNLDLEEFFELWIEMKRKRLTFNFNNNICSNYIIRVCEFYHKIGVIKSGTINYTSPYKYY